MRKPVLQFSHLDDEEFLKHLLTKPNPTEEDNESALRLELLLAHYAGVLEKIHRLASEETADPQAQLVRIRKITAPTETRVARLQ